MENTANIGINQISFQEGEMTVKQFKEYLTKKFGSTMNQKPFNTNYVYGIINNKHLPRYLGGNKLQVRVVEGIRVVKILDEIHNFYAGVTGRKKKVVEEK